MRADRLPAFPFFSGADNTWSNSHEINTRPDVSTTHKPIMTHQHPPANQSDSDWYLGLKSKPSFAFLALMLLIGFMWIPQFLIGPALLFGIWYLIERLLPSKPIRGRGLMRNRTKAALNAIAIVLLMTMIAMFGESVRIAQYNLPTQLAGYGSPFGSGAEQRGTIALCSLIVAVWLGYQAYLAKNSQQIQWMWIFGAFAVAYLPFFHFFLGVLWILVDAVLILLLAVSSFVFRLPQEWPEPAPPSFAPQPPPMRETLEAELHSLKRLLDQGLLNQQEYDAQKQNILRKHGS